MVRKLSNWSTAELLGGAWLALSYDVEPVQPLRVLSHIGGRRAVEQKGNRWEQQFEERYRPEPTFRGHLEFMLRHERIHLEFLARLFEKAGQDELTSWISEQPTGQYARRCGFLYEWLTGRTLDFEGVKNGGYVDALDNELYFTRAEGTKNTRWRVRDNLPGTPGFCPTILLTDTVLEAVEFDLTSAWSGLEAEFGPELLARSAVWLTVKESRSSFAIEGEIRQTDRIRRFAIVMETELGQSDEPLSQETLLHLQRAILGDLVTRHGLRQSPIFVGETRGAIEIVHYVAPEEPLIPAMLEGLSELERSTRGRQPILRAAALSFGFVYIHPLSDGNGRISRFLINDVFRRDGVIPDPFVLPVSAVISAAMRSYDRTLELVSKPLMRRYAEAYRFAENTRYPDGLTSTFHFEAYADATPTWRYLDLTDHAQYLGDVVKTTIEREMRDEARQMRTYLYARRAVNEIVEGSDQDLDRIVRSVSENHWQVSNKLAAEFPILEGEEIRQKIVEAVQEAFGQQPSAPKTAEFDRH